MGGYTPAWASKSYGKSNIYPGKPDYGGRDFYVSAGPDLVAQPAPVDWKRQLKAYQL